MLQLVGVEQSGNDRSTALDRWKEAGKFHIEMPGESSFVSVSAVPALILVRIQSWGGLQIDLGIWWTSSILTLASLA